MDQKPYNFILKRTCKKLYAQHLVIICYLTKNTDTAFYISGL